MSDQSNIAELERRITAALGRIGAGLDKLSLVPPAAQAPAATQGHFDGVGHEAEIAQLKTALAAEKATNAQLNERLKSVKDGENLSQSQLEAKVEKMTQQLDVQGLELQRMRKSTAQLREHLRVLHEAAADNIAEPHLINKAMMAELESLRATRHSETAEMDEILAELKPMIEEARANG